MKQFGLTDKQAEESRQKYGDNSMTEQASESFWDKLKGNLGDPMIKILIVALLINVVLAVLGGVGIIKEGAPEWYEPLGIFVAIALATLVSTFSEYRNENAFQKLQEEASRIMCKVYRNGEIAEVAINDIVVGDAILYSPEIRFRLTVSSSTAISRQISPCSTARAARLRSSQFPRAGRIPTRASISTTSTRCSAEAWYVPATR